LVLQKYFGHQDLIGRFGGDEFVVYVKDFPEDKLIARLNELLEELRRTYVNGLDTVAISASIGVVFSCNGSELSGAQLMEMADEELYKAKNAGRDQYSIKVIE
ncbi:MAG: GGDEF domain-containing protein, partial [Spirochaetales bacterium]|nr:GGDEF domain-containing protein [Spirochaetales bacterium]